MNFVETQAPTETFETDEQFEARMRRHIPELTVRKVGAEIIQSAIFAGYEHANDHPDNKAVVLGVE